MYATIRNLSLGLVVVSYRPNTDCHAENLRARTFLGGQQQRHQPGGQVSRRFDHQLQLYLQDQQRELEKQELEDEEFFNNLLVQEEMSLATNPPSESAEPSYGTFAVFGASTNKNM
jgi:hypothetical protein